MNWRERISIDPRIHHGKPCIKGTRVPASVIVGSIAAGDSPERILKSWPQLTIEDVTAALQFASALAAEATVIPADIDADADTG
ncbi:MAG TPA: DUF433 domain-containing protein [Stellaceae bacterium]|nr:DUF433 domain-containing protein [Stellaceae bacterium]